MKNATTTRSLGFTLVLLALAGCSDVPEAPSAQVQPSTESPAGAEAPSADAERLTLDTTSSKVGFVGAKVTAQHEGGFRELSGTINLVPGDLTQSSLEVEVRTASLYADSDRLTGHLQSPDFFDVERFPTASFRSTSIAAGAEGGTHTITGDLTMHGQTKRVSFPATVTVEAARVSARAEFTINRRDFGIVYPGMPDDLIRDGVVLKIELVAARTTP